MEFLIVLVPQFIYDLHPVFGSRKTGIMFHFLSLYSQTCNTVDIVTSFLARDSCGGYYTFRCDVSVVPLGISPYSAAELHHHDVRPRSVNKEGQIPVAISVHWDFYCSEGKRKSNMASNCFKYYKVWFVEAQSSMFCIFEAEITRMRRRETKFGATLEWSHYPQVHIGETPLVPWAALDRSRA